MKIFKTITHGGISKEALIEQLVKQGVQFNVYANTLFADSAFSIGESIETVNLVKVNLSDLGLAKPSFYKDIVASAEAMGLKLCPLTLGAFLRLQFMEQAEGPYITIASLKTKQDEEYPNGFYVRKLDNIMWLRGYRSTQDYEWPVESEFFFIAAL